MTDTPDPKTTRPDTARPGEAPDDPGRAAGSLRSGEKAAPRRDGDQDGPAGEGGADTAGPAAAGHKE